MARFKDPVFFSLELAPDLFKLFRGYIDINVGNAQLQQLRTGIAQLPAGRIVDVHKSAIRAGPIGGIQHFIHGDLGELQPRGRLGLLAFGNFRGQTGGAFRHLLFQGRVGCFELVQHQRENQKNSTPNGGIPNFHIQRERRQWAKRGNKRHQNCAENGQDRSRPWADKPSGNSDREQVEEGKRKLGAGPIIQPTHQNRQPHRE